MVKMRSRWVKVGQDEVNMGSMRSHGEVNVGSTWDEDEVKSGSRWGQGGVKMKNRVPLLGLKSKFYSTLTHDDYVRECCQPFT